ncbi:MAG: 2Fe-2S iron-sulfur cluster-binding protein, partial [Phycisphaerae bacterium]
MSKPDRTRDRPRNFDVSRRKFLQGAGALAAVPLVSRQIGVKRQPAGAAVKRVGPGEVTCELKIDGRSYVVEIEPRLTLLDVLRDKLDLTGTKEVCGRGACGGCTVQIDGLPVNSCLMLALDAAGAEITTIEGLARRGRLNPLQEAFCRHDALQCGYCTPGFVMSLDALLERKSSPSLQEIRAACSGNICRCGTYPKIFEAALTVAGVDVLLGNVTDNHGKALENEGGRVDAPLKVSGKAKYTADLSLPNMAYATIIVCPYGRARLRSYDEEAARKVKGVLDVTIHQREEYVYCGQPAGHVCAETPQAVDDAIAALDLKWTTLEPSTDPIAEHERVVGPIPPPLDQADGARGAIGSGGRRQAVQQIFENGHRILERTYTTQIQTHSCLEPHSAVADYRGAEAQLWCSAQGTGATHAAAAETFGLDRSKVRVHCEHVGGGF